MKTQQAIDLAGSPKALADLFGITQSAVSQWGDEIPKPRYWQLRVIRPSWFEKKRTPTNHPGQRASDKQQGRG